MSKKPFNIDRALAAIEKAVKPWPKAAMFELAEAGFDTPFEQLAACMISIRTYDEVTVPTARKLFEKARTPAQMSVAAREIVNELRHQYLIAFEPTGASGWHALELRTRKSNLVVRARSGYMAGPSPRDSSSQ